MTIQSMQLDPNAVAYTDDEIVGKVNTAAANISRAGSVLAAARPIAAGEVGATELEHEAFLATEKTKLGDVEKDAKDLQVVPSWVASTAYVLGDAIEPTMPNGYKYVCTVAGTSGVSEPTWGTTEGGEIVDSTATWTCWKYAASTVNADKLIDGVTNKAFTATEDTKLAGVEVNAKDDQTGTEMRDGILALADTERGLVKTNPLTGEYKIIAIQRNVAGELDIDYDDVAES